MLRPCKNVLRSSLTRALSTVTVQGVTLMVDASPLTRLNPLLATGSKVWPAAEVLCRYFETDAAARLSLHGANVLELGAGLGVVGMATAVLGAARVCMTDRLILNNLKACDLQLVALKQSIDKNIAAITSANNGCQPKLSVAELEFGNRDHMMQVLDSHGPFDVIIGTDITYNPPTMLSVVDSLRFVCDHAEKSGFPRAVIYLAQQCRSKEQEGNLMSELKTNGFAVKSVSEDRSFSIMCAEFCTPKL